MPPSVALGPPLNSHLPSHAHDQFRETGLAALREAGDTRPAAERLGDWMHQFVRQGRLGLSAGVRAELAAMPGREASLVQAAIGGLSRDLAVVPGLSEGRLVRVAAAASGPATGRPSARRGADVLGASTAWRETVQVLVARASDLLLALRLGGEDEAVVQYVQGVLTHLVSESAWGLVLVTAAAAQGCDVRQLAPAALAAALTNRPVRRWNSAGETVVEAGFTAGLARTGPLGVEHQRHLADALAEQQLEVDALVGAELQRLTDMAGERLQLPRLEAGRQLRFGGARPGAANGAGEGTGAEGGINVRLLVGFLASGRGHTDEARLLGIADLVRDVRALAQEAGGESLPPWDRLVVRRTLEALERMGRLVRDERLAHKKIEQVWRAMDEQLRRAQGSRRDEHVEVRLPHIEALDARSLYYQDAIMNGMPVGVVLAELYDSDDVTFGPTERRWFERVVCYAARRYAANTAAMTHPVFDTLTPNPSAAEHVRAMVRGIEAELRGAGVQSDDALRATAVRRLQELSRDGEIKAGEVRRLLEPGADGAPGLVDDMLLRLRAEQDVRVITAWLSVHGELSTDLITLLRQLPQVSTFASREVEGGWFWNRTARNGQSYFELERDTRQRWLRYRQEAPAYRDVRPVAIPGAEEEVGMHNPLNLRAVQPGRQPLPKGADPDDVVVRPRPGGGGGAQDRGGDRGGARR